MNMKKIIQKFVLLNSFAIPLLHAELPLTHIRGLANGLQPHEIITTQSPSAISVTAIPRAAHDAPDMSTSGNIFSPIYGALAWHSPYVFNLWQLDSDSATANLVKQLFNLQHDGITFDISGLPANTISHLSCEDIGYIIGLLYNYEQAMEQYRKHIESHDQTLQEERTLSTEGSPQIEQKSKKSPGPISPSEKAFSDFKNKRPLEIKKELTDKLIARLATIDNALVKQHIIEFYTGQIAHAVADIAREQDEAKRSALQDKKVKMESIIAAETDVPGVALIAYNQGKNAFVKDLVNSMLDDRYLPHNTILLLLSCMWKKANSMNDIIHYLYGAYTALDNKNELFDDRITAQLHGMSQTAQARTHAAVTAIPVAIENTSQSITYEDFAAIVKPVIDLPPYTAEDYQAIIGANPTELYKHFADFAFVFFGFDIFGGPLTTLLPAEASMTMHARYGETSFPDCGETSLLNFFAAIMYNPQGHNWNNALLNAVNAHPLLQKFFEDYSPTNLGTQAAHDTWANVASAHPGVNYTRPNRCEINSGIDNMLKVIAALIPGANTFDDLARILTSNGIKITFGMPEPLLQRDSKKISIKLTKNTTSLTLEWKFYPGHFHLSFPPKRIESDPRTRFFSFMPKMFFNIPANYIIIKALLSRFADSYDSSRYNYDKYYQTFLYNLKNPRDILETIKTILTTSPESNEYRVFIIRALYNLLSKITLPEDDQRMYQREFWDLITHSTINIQNIIPDKELTGATDIQKTFYTKELLSKPINKPIVSKIQKIALTLQADNAKTSFIKQLLQLDPTPLTQPLYETIAHILPSIQDENEKLAINYDLARFIEHIEKREDTAIAALTLYRGLADNTDYQHYRTVLLGDIFTFVKTVPLTLPIVAKLQDILANLRADDAKIFFIERLLYFNPNNQLMQPLREAAIRMLAAVKNVKARVMTAREILKLNPTSSDEVMARYSEVAHMEPSLRQLDPDTYYQYLHNIFELARKSMHAHGDGHIAVGNVALWRLFGSMLYPEGMTNYSIRKMINFISRKWNFLMPVVEKFGMYKQIKPVYEQIESIVLDAYIQRNPSAQRKNRLYETLAQSN